MLTSASEKPKDRNHFAPTCVFGLSTGIPSMPFDLCPDLDQPCRSLGLPDPGAPGFAAGIDFVTALFCVTNARPPNPPPHPPLS
jgi:hypothetical protein